MAVLIYLGRTFKRRPRPLLMMSELWRASNQRREIVFPGAATQTRRQSICPRVTISISLGHQLLVSEINVQQTGQALPVRPRSIIQGVLQTSKTSSQVTNSPSFNSLSQPSLPLKPWIAMVTHPCALSVALNLRPPVATEILAGRTQLHLGNWRKIASDQWVLEVIQGYKLELTSLPEQLQIPSSETDRISAGLISEEVQAIYVGQGCHMLSPAKPRSWFLFLNFSSSQEGWEVQACSKSPSIKQVYPERWPVIFHPSRKQRNKWKCHYPASIPSH